MQKMYGFVFLYKKVFIYLWYNLKITTMRNQRRELHPEYKGIRICTDRCNGRVNYYAYYAKNRNNVGKHFDCVNKAVKWLDMQCVIQGIPQKNNTFKKA